MPIRLIHVLGNCVGVFLLTLAVLAFLGAIHFTLAILWWSVCTLFHATSCDMATSIWSCL